MVYKRNEVCIKQKLAKSTDKIELQAKVIGDFQKILDFIKSILLKTTDKNVVLCKIIGGFAENSGVRKVKIVKTTDRIAVQAKIIGGKLIKKPLKCRKYLLFHR